MLKKYKYDWVKKVAVFGIAYILGYGVCYFVIFIPINCIVRAAYKNAI